MRIVEGMAGHRPLNHDEPQIETKLDEVAAPDHLSALEQKIWRETLAHCPPGMLTALDMSTFESWVVARGNYINAKKYVDAYGQRVKGPGGNPIPNPYVADMRNFLADMSRESEKLGFTPTSRTRVKVKKSSGSSSPFADLKSLSAD